MQKLDLEKTVIETFPFVPDSKRDENIAYSLSKGIPQLRDFGETKEDEVALVGFGPSLHNTWHKIKDFRTIFTMSGSKQFLLQKGLKPSDFDNWYHIEIDLNLHKCQLLGQPQKGIKYLISSACHPKMHDMLEGYDETLWHLCETENVSNLPTLFPRGVVVVTGGSNVGLRALVLIRVLGYRNYHIFGYDNSFAAPTGLQHASFHPNRTPDVCITELDGRTFYTTASMVHYAREFLMQMEQLPDVTIYLYGDGLLQTWVKKTLREGKGEFPRHQVSGIALKMPQLIGEEYRALNRKLHETNAEFGSFGHTHKEIVIDFLKLNPTIKSILDYGCGKGTLAKHLVALGYDVREYDPAIPGKDKEPDRADLVVCTDVLEHVELEYLENVIGDISRLSKMATMFAIGLVASSKSLDNESNAHQIIENKFWWCDQLEKYFDIRRAEVFRGVVSDGTVYEEAFTNIIATPKLTQIISQQALEREKNEYNQQTQ
jgi:hypothetical protein